MNTLVVTRGDARVRARGFGSGERWLRAGARCVTGAVFGLAAMGCSGMETDTQGGESVATQSDQLETNLWRGFGDPPGNPSHPEYPVAAPTPIAANPVVCSNKGGFTNIFIRDNNDHYQGRTMALEDGVGTGPWSGAIGSTQFWSSPSCAMLYPTYNATAKTDNTILLAGKGFDNRIYGQLLFGDSTSSGPSDPVSPPAQTTWVALSNTQYVGDTNGFPATAANGSRMVVAFRNGNTIYAQNHSLPFTFTPWGGAQAAPALPFGVTLTGVPAITYVGASTNAFVVVIKSTTAGVIYWASYSGTAWVGGWNREQLPHTLTSDPAMEWVDNVYPDSTSYVALTLYFRDETKQVVQTSVQSPSQFAGGSYFYIPDSDAGSTILGTPSAVFGGGLEAGIRTVIVQGYTPATPQALQSSWYLITEDFCGAEGRCTSP
jgi:hypothetical protein